MNPLELPIPYLCLSHSIPERKLSLNKNKRAYSSTSELIPERVAHIAPKRLKMSPLNLSKILDSDSERKEDSEFSHSILTSALPSDSHSISSAALPPLHPHRLSQPGLPSSSIALPIPPSFSQIQERMAFIPPTLFELEALSATTAHQKPLHSHSENYLGSGLNYIVEANGKSADGIYETVSKTVRPDKGPNQLKKINRESLHAYIRLLENNVPVAKLFSVPEQLKIELHKKAKKEGKIKDITSMGNNWVIERLSINVPIDDWKESDTPLNALSPQAQAFLKMAKYWLTASVKEKRLLIGDFKPDNVMMSDQGEIKIVDYAYNPFASLNKNESDEHEFYTDLFNSLNDWSCGNESIKNWLISDFDEAVKEGINQYSKIITGKNFLNI
ncbi:MAG: hypothetical protein WD595_06380 [Waddliaceae bacterium]